MSLTTHVSYLTNYRLFRIFASIDSRFHFSENDLKSLAELLNGSLNVYKEYIKHKKEISQWFGTKETDSGEICWVSLVRYVELVIELYEINCESTH